MPKKQLSHETPRATGGSAVVLFGQDVLAHPEAQHVALLSHNHDVALFRDGQMIVLGLDHRCRTYRYDAVNDRYTSVTPDPALEKLAIAYYQVAFDLFRAHRFM